MSTPTIRIINDDVRAGLRTLPDESVHCCVTSPPYYGLRAYGTKPGVWGSLNGCRHEWQEFVRPGQTGGNNDKNGIKGSDNFQSFQQQQQQQQCSLCGAWRGELGLEPTPQMYVQHLVDVFREVRRVLRDDGTLWLNIGDSYSGGGRGNYDTVSSNKGNAASRGLGRPSPDGYKPKDLIGIPWMLAFALREDGWYLRADIIWAKGVSFCPTYSGGSMPESVRDRPSKSHEYVFLLSKSERYYYDRHAVAESAAQPDRKRADRFGGNKHTGETTMHSDGSTFTGAATRNLRSVWTINTKPCKLAHFALFPPALIEPMIKAGSVAGGTILDPFMGSGTTACVAARLWRNSIGIELNPEYVAIAEQRIAAEAGCEHILTVDREEAFTG